ncbi:hypothetical protein HYH03_015954 [Edaphochlamys debaryana]|uniref:BTB domain-containing protein n=1 Tax=Edaphochlamys debaryana TaxID=47281 RepID=A0A835XKR2_9CHLO|nr:hypothetical protein HYH03_015954 [Edaphochlamys debaryana]|eukprot:KAG2485279.1 hypothetical protein HYH03_015954 [Edaphochlamys debaryana]
MESSVSGSRLALVCKGGATVQARAATLVSASPVLRDALDKPLPTAAELRLEEDDAKTWAAALRLLEPKEHPEAPALSAANLESVLVLADKYDMAAVRCICVGFMGSHMTGTGLDPPLTSPINILRAATLIERYCAQPELKPHTAPVLSVLERALTSADDSLTSMKELLDKVAPHVDNKSFQELVAPSLQIRLMRVAVRSMRGLEACASCGCLHGFTDGYPGNWKHGATVQARTATLAGASPVLCEALEKPLAKPGELRLEEDDPAAWGTVLGMLESAGHGAAAPLSWANLEAVLVLADKYDMAAVRCICMGFMASRTADLGLAAPLASPNNILKAATLIERYCGQPGTMPYTQPVTSLLDYALDCAGKRQELLPTLAAHVLHRGFPELVSPSVQVKVLRTLAASVSGMRPCTSCGCLHGFTASTYSWKCAQCGRGHC